MDHLTADERKAQGAHYTPPELARFVAREMVAAWGGKQGVVEVLDPAVGGGDLLEAVVRELSGDIRVRGIDRDEVAVENAQRRMAALGMKGEISEGDFLESLTDGGGAEPPADLVIANPPYVRTQVLGAEKAQALAEQFSLKGRVDLSFPFVLGIIERLKPGGVAGIITSNRFLSTRAGTSLRERLRESVQVLHVWDLGDTKLFEAAVLPCVLLLRKAGPGEGVSQFTSVYSASSQEGRADPAKLFAALATDKTGVVELGGAGQRYEIKRGHLEVPESAGGVWRLRNDETAAWSRTVGENTWRTLGQLAKVRVGVKTTADPVFIREDWDVVCPDGLPETLRPLITHHLAGRFRGQPPVKRMLYTHEVVDGKKVAIDLARCPKAASYLETHRERLEGRKYVAKAGRQWFEIWVPQEPSAWELPKIVFKDIAERPTFWLDVDGAVVNGDCYWFTLGEELGELHWLALGVFNSRFIEAFYDAHFANKLYSGRRRFMTQYVSEFPLPDPAGEAARRVVVLAQEIYAAPEKDAELGGELDAAVEEAFGLGRP